jgi:hypothetical protein
MEKVVILLTDGNNEWYDYPGITFQWGGSGANHYTGIPGANQYPNTTTPNYRTKFQNDWPDADYTAYGRLSEGRLGTTNPNSVKAVIDDRMLEMCETMKAQGIIIYTMTFGGSPSTSTKTMYETCATEPDMYFHAPTGTALQQAFVEIADQLTALRIAE